MKELGMEYRVGGIFAFAGLIFFVIGCFVCYQTFPPQHEIVNIKGTIEKISFSGTNHPTAYVKYKVNGKEYERSLPNYNSGMKVGKTVSFYYNKENPGEIGTNSENMKVLLVPGFGLLVIALGSSFMIVKERKKKLAKKLRKTGERIEGEYLQTIYNRSCSLNGVSPYYIRCQWKDEVTGQTYLFRSENIWFNPMTAIQEKKITTFPIYRDPIHKNKYTIVLDSILEDVVDLS